MSRRYTAGPCDTCGYTAGPAKTEKLAAYGLRAHSCTKQIEAQARAARGKAKRDAVDRTPKPCLHKRATHQHGTHACYVLDRCRCHPCADANTAYERQRSRRHAYGRWDHWVDAEPVREHVKNLQRQGLGLKQIVRLSGYSQGAITRLMYGRLANETNRRDEPTSRIRRDSADAILAVRATMDTLAPGQVIDIAGTARRLQALMANGWSQTKLAHRLGYEVRNFNHLVHGKRQVTVASARRVRDLYEELWDQVPPRETRGDLGAYTRTLRYAQARGWVPPLAWDDDTIDDPNAQPYVDEQAAPRARFELEDVDDCIDWGMDRRQAAHRLGVTLSALEQRCGRENRRDLLERLDRNALAREAS